jgi:hypothetical protein
MSCSDRIRWGGLAAMLGGVAFIVLMLIPEGSPGSFLYRFERSRVHHRGALHAGGAGGFHALQKGNYGRIGHGGLYTVIAAGSDQILAQIGLMSGSMAFRFLDFLGIVGVMVGLVLYGAATLQARVLPRWCGVGFIVCLPVWWVLSVILGNEYGGSLGGMLFALL